MRRQEMEVKKRRETNHAAIQRLYDISENSDAFHSGSFQCQLSRLPTLMPAERHLPTASGTAARGGSIIDIRPTKQRFSVWKLTSSVSKAKPLEYLSSGRNRWQKPAVMRDEKD